METIKQAGLKKLIRQKEFSDPSLQINTLLTSDLTAQEIEDSLKVISDMLPPLTEFLNKYGDLSEKLEDCEKKDKSITEQASDLKSGFWLGPIIFLGIGLSVCFVLFSHQMISEQGSIGCAVLWSLGCVCLFFLSWASVHERSDVMLFEKRQQLEEERDKLKKQVENLAATDILRNATFGVSTLSALIVTKRIIALGDTLRKMHIIASDQACTASSRLLTMENLLYLLKKQERDEELLDETKRANRLAEEKVKAMQKVERAVNLQTEYQIWQDRGYELGKLSAASRLYRDD